jgi:hypothetical protein
MGVDEKSRTRRQTEKKKERMSKARGRSVVAGEVVTPLLLAPTDAVAVVGYRPRAQRLQFPRDGLQCCQ